MVESAVKTVKRLIKKVSEDNTDPWLAILEHRNTPTEGMNSSPAQRLLSCRTRTLLPTSEKLLKPQLAEGVLEEVKTGIILQPKCPRSTIIEERRHCAHPANQKRQGTLEESDCSGEGKRQILQGPNRRWFHT